MQKPSAINPGYNHRQFPETYDDFLAQCSKCPALSGWKSLPVQAYPRQVDKCEMFN